VTVALYIIKPSSPARPSVPQGLYSIEELNRRVAMAFASLNAGSVFPAGFIALTAEQAAPVGWLVCDGTALSRTAFPDLFAKIGTTYGPGDNVTTFNIPTQAQCVPPSVAETPPQVVTGGSIEPVTPTSPPPVVENEVGGSGSNSGTSNRVVGGRGQYTALP
jgi:hypothetical protein